MIIKLRNVSLKCLSMLVSNGTVSSIKSMETHSSSITTISGLSFVTNYIRRYIVPPPIEWPGIPAKIEHELKGDLNHLIIWEIIVLQRQVRRHNTDIRKKLNKNDIATCTKKRHQTHKVLNLVFLKQILHSHCKKNDFMWIDVTECTEIAIEIYKNK